MALNWIRVNHRSLDNWCLNNERCWAALTAAHGVVRSSQSSPSAHCLHSARLLPRVLIFFLGTAEGQQLCATPHPTPHYSSQPAHCLKAFSHLLPRPVAVTIQDSVCLFPGLLQPAFLTVQLKCHVPTRP